MSFLSLSFWFLFHKNDKLIEKNETSEGKTQEKLLECEDRSMQKILFLQILDSEMMIKSYWWK